MHWYEVTTLRRLITVLLLCSSLLIVISYFSSAVNSDYVYYELELSDESGCTIPRLDPWDARIQDLILKADPLLCKRLQYDVTFMNEEGRIRVNKTEIEKIGSILCYIRCFDRRTNDDFQLQFEEWQELEDDHSPKCEFSEVRCDSVHFPHTTLYTNMHAKIIPKAFEKSNNRPGVLLFVLDSISTSNFHRSLPLTLQVLKNDYSTHIFEGFTKVGDNSFPNAAAFLTGKRVMAAGYDNELPYPPLDGFDTWPLVWRDFSRANYFTFYAEDYPDFNLFAYLATGFRQPPVDHYFRPFWLALYGSQLHRRSTHLCCGHAACHDVQMDYLSRFLSAYRNQSTFALHWLTELGHDYGYKVEQGDASIARFFATHRQFIKDSFVFVFSDHGHRFDAIRQSIVGRIEERMPFFSMSLPADFERKYPRIAANVKENKKVLTSFWDLHATLADILQHDFESIPTTPQSTGHRGISLLRNIPARSCREASIPDEFCVCQKEAVMSTTDMHAERASAVLTRHVNALLLAYTECAQLTRDRIMHALRVLPNRNLADDTQAALRVRVSVVLAPSGGIFEALVEYDRTADLYTVIGDVNRVNAYGNQSLCVRDQQLRKYCYCKSQ